MTKQQQQQQQRNDNTYYCVIEWNGIESAHGWIDSISWSNRATGQRDTGTTINRAIE